MRNGPRHLFQFCLLANLAFGSFAVAQTDYSEELLRVKRRFADAEIVSLSETYQGVETDSGRHLELFPLRKTGISTGPIVAAANTFLRSLTPAQNIKTLFAVDDSEWRKWSNVDNGIYVRQGVSLEEMNKAQKQAALNLMAESLSAKGLELSFDIMKTDQTLREINNSVLQYGEEKYFFTVMGVPSNVEPWGWQLDGHHLIVNYFVLGNQVVVTPMFLGGEPVVTESGKYKGNEILQDEQNQVLALLQSLDVTQRAAAVIQSDKSPTNLLAGAGRDNLILNYEGIPAADLSMDQKHQLVSLIRLFVTNIRNGHAQVRMDEILQHLDGTYFAWVGGNSDDAVFYYRIHSPVILIEFDHQRPVGMPSLVPGIPTRQHTHVMVRTPNGNDYGKDLLRQHLETHPH
jgi:hypothetical protein